MSEATAEAFEDFIGTQILDPWKGPKKVPEEEYFTSGHRTCRCVSRLNS